MNTGGLLNRVFPDNPNIDNSEERTVNLWVAGLVLAAIVFCVAVKRGLGSGAM